MVRAECVVHGTSIESGTTRSKTAFAFFNHLSIQIHNLQRTTYTRHRCQSPTPASAIISTTIRRAPAHEPETLRGMMARQIHAGDPPAAVALAARHDVDALVLAGAVGGWREDEVDVLDVGVVKNYRIAPGLVEAARVVYADGFAAVYGTGGQG